MTRRGAALLLLLFSILVFGSGTTSYLGLGTASGITATSTSVAATGGEIAAQPQQVQVSSEVVVASGGGDTQAAPPTPPAPRGAAAILMNLDDGRVLYETAADERRSIASTTKIMTGILAIELLPPEQVIKTSKKAAAAGESEIWLEPGEELTVEEMLYALMVKSANDAAVALGEAASGDLESFVKAMNAKAVELGMTNTHYANPHGLEAKEHYSSARDLAILSRYAMKNDLFRKLVATPTVKIPWQGREYDRVLENRNALVGAVPFITGIKTGYTSPAGFCLVGSGAQDGASLVSVILGEKDKGSVNDDTVALLEWGFARYRQVDLIDEGLPIAEMDVPYHVGEKLAVGTDRKLVRTLYDEDVVTKTVTVQEKLVLPVVRGQALGKVTFATADGVIGEVDLVAERAIEAPTLGVKLRYVWDRMIRWLGKVA